MTVNVSSMAPGKNYVYLDGAVADKIWVPDVVIDKVRTRDIKSIIISSTTMQTIAIRSPSMVKSGASSIRLYADSTIVYSSRKNYDLACGMVSVLYIMWSLHQLSLCPGLSQVPLRQPDLQPDHPLLRLLHQGLHSEVGLGKLAQPLLVLLLIVPCLLQDGCCRQDRQP